MRWAREWAQVHRGEDLAARAEEICEDTLKRLEESTNEAEDTVDTVYLQLEEVETLVQQAAQAHTHAWGHPTEEAQDVAKAADLLREGRQADVIYHDGGTSSQPPGLASAQPQLPLRALQKLRALEPFLAGQERELLMQAMADLSTWSTQFWGHPVVVVGDDNHTTQMDQPEVEREPSAGHKLTEDLWQSMVESSGDTNEREDTYNRETLLLPGRGPSGEPEEGGPPQVPAGSGEAEQREVPDQAED